MYLAAKLTCNFSVPHEGAHQVLDIRKPNPDHQEEDLAYQEAVFLSLSVRSPLFSGG